MRAHVPGDRLRITAARYRPDGQVVRVLCEHSPPGNLGGLFPLVDVGKEGADVPSLFCCAYCAIHLIDWNCDSTIISLPYAEGEGEACVNVASNQGSSVIDP